MDGNIHRLGEKQSSLNGQLQKKKELGYFSYSSSSNSFQD